MLKNKPINARSGFMTEVTAMKSDPTERCDVISEPQSGMTLLEYYAGEAFSALLKAYYDGAFVAISNVEDTVARRSIEFAKALIAALEAEARGGVE